MLQALINDFNNYELILKAFNIPIGQNIPESFINNIQIKNGNEPLRPKRRRSSCSEQIISRNN